MIRVLIVLGGAMKYGGTEAFLMNYYRNLDRTRIQFDFVFQGDEPGAYDEEILGYGGMIYHVPFKKHHPIRFHRQLKKLIRDRGYRIVHGQMDTMNAWVMCVAKHAGVPVRISHSHNTGIQGKNLIKRAMHGLIKFAIPLYATDLWACSRDAGEWLYGKKRLNRGEVIVIHNAIDLERFSFSDEDRRHIRKEYQIDETSRVIGHVGRLAWQKNHQLLIRVFAGICETEENVRLLLVGDGDLRDSLEELAAKLNVNDKVIFAGNQRAPFRYYNAMDVFVFPSLFEGLGITLLEAQANGLFCICSDQIPPDGLVSEAKCISLDEPVSKWVEAIKENLQRERSNNMTVLIEKGFDIKREARALADRYEQLLSLRDK